MSETQKVILRVGDLITFTQRNADGFFETYEGNISRSFAAGTGRPTYTRGEAINLGAPFSVLTEAGLIHLDPRKEPLTLSRHERPI